MGFFPVPLVQFQIDPPRWSQEELGSQNDDDGSEIFFCLSSTNIDLLKASVNRWLIAAECLSIFLLANWRVRVRFLSLRLTWVEKLNTSLVEEDHIVGLREMSQCIGALTGTTETFLGTNHSPTARSRKMRFIIFCSETSFLLNRQPGILQVVELRRWRQLISFRVCN